MKKLSKKPVYLALHKNPYDTERFDAVLQVGDFATPEEASELMGRLRDILSHEFGIETVLQGGKPS